MKTLAVALLGLFAGAAMAQDKLSVRLDWTPWAIHAPIHLAAEKGWFKQHGIDATVEDGNGSVTTVQLVGSGRFDVGNASLAPMMIARDKGLSVRAIANFLRKNDIGLLVPRGSTMKTPKDLVGKKIIFTAGSLEAPFLDSFLAAGKLKREQVELLNVEAAAKVPTYAAERADGVFSTVPFVLPLVEANRPSDAILFSDYGLQFPSFGLLSSEEKIKERGPAIRRFASIVAGAWEYILAGHEDEAVKAIIAQRPQAKLDAKVLRAQIDSLRAFFQTQNSKGLPMGVMADADWAAGIKTMAAVSLIKDAPASGFYTNDMLDRALIAKIAQQK
ncbi:MAG TPA: ABC transporter substrate-binding protein [Burkholderiales bacterium]|nr:ABC transporter substrate-binding protein [Burkholderiales bacterium]